jgi:hypothetical protein
MSPLQNLCNWSPQTLFDGVLCVATVTEALALVYLYKLEKRQDERNTRVELPVRFYDDGPTNQEGAPRGPCQPMIEVMNCSATSAYINEVTLEAETEKGTKKAANYKIQSF